MKNLWMMLLIIAGLTCSCRNQPKTTPIRVKDNIFEINNQVVPDALVAIEKLIEAVNNNSRIANEAVSIIQQECDNTRLAVVNFDLLLDGNETYKVGLIDTYTSSLAWLDEFSSIVDASTGAITTAGVNPQEIKQLATDIVGIQEKLISALEPLRNSSLTALQVSTAKNAFGEYETAITNTNNHLAKWELTQLIIVNSKIIPQTQAVQCGKANS